MEINEIGSDLLGPNVNISRKISNLGMKIHSQREHRETEKGKLYLYVLIRDYKIYRSLIIYSEPILQKSHSLSRAYIFYRHFTVYPKII